ncbi:molybdate ABC transporter substrate-binding protein [Paenibacillus sp. R14(2021)]|uniref:molybdate ABC transporter substrate-binding protein n=1 Tax=Paenibacillus sp. R14(2021) TaxID=2859228 RepID=UPI0021571478|nr:molybdate ABC transporter substrate-binding protein [Paenibacillus sp. R14(2021)]
MFKFIRGHAVWLLFMLMVSIMLTGCGGANKGASDSGTGAGSPAQPSTQGNPASPNSDSKPSDELVELIVSAAASMSDALQDVKQRYEAAHPSVAITYNLGASGALEKQIEQGAPVDLFLSASTKNMDALAEKQLIDPADQVDLLSNKLVVVVPKNAQAAVASIADLAKPEVKKLAIGIPESVPAGSYAKEALNGAKLWDKVQAKTVQGKDVRQVLQYVETGNADAGFVYRTDALTSKQVSIAFTVDSAAYSAILYPGAIVKATKHPQEAADFFTYLQSSEAQGIFAAYGFNVIK